MNTHRRPARITSVFVSIALVMLNSSTAAAQQTLDFQAVLLPLPTGATASEARGIAERGWEPLTIAGAAETSTQNKNASCWIRVSNVWSAHMLPGLSPTGDSWANAVDHAPAAQGEWTLVVGAAMDESGVQRPMRWDNVKNQPWTGTPLPTPPGGSGEVFSVYLLFKPDGTPLRARACGWVSEAPPTVPSGGATQSVPTGAKPAFMPIGIGGSNLIYPEFPAGLDGVMYDVSSSDNDVLMGVGGGENAVGQWRPQLWTSLDDGQTWSNEELPLPLGVPSGEVTDVGHEVGHWLGAGWGMSTAGATVPLLWEMNTNDPIPTWIVHELPLPPLDEGGQNGFVRKRPGRTMYANIVLKRGLDPVVGIWVDELGGGWSLYEPDDYLINPEIGVPVAPAGIDKYGRIAVKFPNPPGSTETRNGAAPMGTTAGLLIPSPETGVGDGASPQRLIALTASPNPFQSGVRIGFTLPWDASVKVSIHDVSGRVVASFDRGQRAAGDEHVLRWDGIADDGQRAASGVYFVRVETPYAKSTLKLVRIE
ncbi:MAG TPA: FlgD immunoglobulin-like domain containing protein [Candidatus Krumholzibacteria bacterium]|nr:FlgD immunoglobulin-like domain containing protein [Candidatus Krumholzibacteria bacterium]